MSWFQSLMNWLGGALVALAAAMGLGGGGPLQLQGYVEGEYVYVASPVAGRLQSLEVARGTQVKAGAPLFRLDPSSEQPARDDAAAKLAQAKANLANLKKGKRPSEIEAIQAQLAQANAMLQLSAAQLRRQEHLIATHVASRETLDQAQADHARDTARVAELQAELETARLGARADEIEAAEQAVTAAKAQLAQADWRLGQLSQAAPKAGLVVDTLYRPGEWVTAGSPVIQMLPPENVKIRFFVPEPRLGSIQVGEEVKVRCDSCARGLVATISFISPDAEYTPPVIYSREMRAKLVYLVEAKPSEPGALRPGQPVDVTLPPVPAS
jgi:HlyD family secretion protein